MAFFKFRKAADEPAKAPLQPQSIDVVRQRAKYRLAGSTVLVVIGIIGLPLLFDRQPRPIAVDTPIDIPDRNKVAPLALPAVVHASAVTPAVNAPLPESGLTKTAAAFAAAASTVASSPVHEASEPVAVPVKPVVQAAAVAGKVIDTADKKPPQAIITEMVVAPKVIAKETKAPASVPVILAQSVPTKVGTVAKSPDVKPATPAKSSDTKAAAPAKAPVAKSSEPRAPDAKQAVTKTPDSAPAQGGRYILQVGAFADGVRAHEVRLKLEHAGLKTYTHIAETPEGKRYRVRVGPFAAKAEAEKVAVKIKKLNLPAALLTL